jgi:hypothetical protein
MLNRGKERENVMRSWMLAALGASALIANTPAEAGLRAVYFDAAKTKSLVIEVADNGDARIGEADSDDYGLLIGGHFYVVGSNEGRPMVADVVDLGAAIDQIMPPIFRDILKGDDGASPPGDLRISEDGTRSVGGRTGRVFHVKGLDDSAPDKAVDYVIDAGADLAPVGTALEKFMNAALIPAAPLVGPAIPHLIAETRSIFALGTPIDVGGRFLLDRVETVDVPAQRLALPGKPASVADLVATMRAEQQDNAHR